MLKKLMSVILIIMCVFSLSSCGSDKGYIKLFGEKIPEGVYNYYYAEAFEQSDEPEAAAEYSVKKYIAAERLMKKEGLTLSTNYKRMAAEETEKIWSLFSDYYEGIGVSKQDITHIKAHEMSIKELVHFYYGAGGKNEVSDSELRETFAKKYVGFRAVEASFLTVNDVGESIEKSEGEKKSLRNKFKAMAERVNTGVSIDNVNESYNEGLGLIVTQSLSLNVIKESDPLYGADFFKKVSELSYGEAAVIENGSSIYLLERVRIDSNDETFSVYAAEVLEGMKTASVEKKIDKMAKELN